MGDWVRHRVGGLGLGVPPATYTEDTSPRRGRPLYRANRDNPKNRDPCVRFVVGTSVLEGVLDVAG